MNSKQEILRKLREWRNSTAKHEGVEQYRVLSNQTLSDIIVMMPKTKEELMGIKGIKDKKFHKYGRDIFAILNSNSTSNPQETHSLSTVFSTETSPQSLSSSSRLYPPSVGPTPLVVQLSEPVSVSVYLDTLNRGLGEYSGKVQGEISSLDIRGNYLFFGLKDKEDGSTMNCFMWMNSYKLSGVELAEGLEIVASGFPEIYKPSGRLSFRTDMVELVGEGALKLAYEKLKRQLEKEGLFAPERKKIIPDYPHTIGLITSSTGAVIHDFLNNIGRFGFHIKFLDSRVEGALAVKELIASVRTFKKRKDIDVLVMVRGGGSLESLQAFNNEILVREISSCPFPVIVGIGHDKDVPLVALAADKACSTPTAVAKLLNASWEQAGAKVRYSEQKILSAYARALQEKIFFAERLTSSLEKRLHEMIEKVRSIIERFSQSMPVVHERLVNIVALLPKIQRILLSQFAAKISNAHDKVRSLEKILAAQNPERQLKLGWSIAFSQGKVVRSTRDVSPGDNLDVRVSDGTIKTQTL